MNKIILLVEDDPDEEELAVRAFKNTGIASQVKVERDGASALDHLFGTGKYAGDTLPERPTIVILDLQLPRVHGLEVLRRIRADERTNLLPVIVLTKSNENDDVKRSYANGANAYVRKAVDFLEFAAAAKAIALFWLLLNEPPPT
jgi:CheY-like chemotaxis protein